MLKRLSSRLRNIIAYPFDVDLELSALSHLTFEAGLTKEAEQLRHVVAGGIPTMTAETLRRLGAIAREANLTRAARWCEKEIRQIDRPSLVRKIEKWIDTLDLFGLPFGFVNELSNFKPLAREAGLGREAADLARYVYTGRRPLGPDHLRRIADHARKVDLNILANWCEREIERISEPGPLRRIRSWLADSQFMWGRRVVVSNQLSDLAHVAHQADMDNEIDELYMSMGKGGRPLNPETARRLAELARQENLNVVAEWIENQQYRHRPNLLDKPEAISVRLRASGFLGKPTEELELLAFRARQAGLQKEATELRRVLLEGKHHLDITSLRQLAKIAHREDLKVAEQWCEHEINRRTPPAFVQRTDALVEDEHEIDHPTAPHFIHRIDAFFETATRLNEQPNTPARNQEHIASRENQDAVAEKRRRERRRRRRSQFW